MENCIQNTAYPQPNRKRQGNTRERITFCSVAVFSKRKAIQKHQNQFQAMEILATGWIYSPEGQLSGSQCEPGPGFQRTLTGLSSGPATLTARCRTWSARCGTLTTTVTRGFPRCTGVSANQPESEQRTQAFIKASGPSLPNDRCPFTSDP